MNDIKNIKNSFEIPVNFLCELTISKKFCLCCIKWQQQAKIETARHTADIHCWRQSQYQKIKGA